MRIIKEICLPAKRINEDLLLTDSEYFLLMDGATGLGDNVLDSNSDAQFFCRFVCGYIQENYTPATDIRALFKAAVRRLKADISGMGLAFSQRYHEPSASVCFVAERKNEIDLFVLCNITVVVEKRDGTKDVFFDGRQDALDEQNIQRMIKAAKEKNINVIDARKYIEHDIRDVRNQMNQIGGYDVLGLDDTSPDRAKTKTYNKKDIRRILAFSDGFSGYYNEMKLASSLDAFYEIVVSHDIHTIYSTLRAAEKQDDQCNDCPRFKVGDDVSLVLAAFDE